MSPAKASNSSAGKAAKKAEKAQHSSGEFGCLRLGALECYIETNEWRGPVAKRHPQPASTSEYRDIGSSNIPEGSVKSKKPDGSDKKVQVGF